MNELWHSCFFFLAVLFHVSVTHIIAHRASLWLQGTPEFVATSQCVHYFEWRTYSACKNNKFTPQKEVRGGCGGKKGGRRRRGDELNLKCQNTVDGREDVRAARDNCEEPHRGIKKNKIKMHCLEKKFFYPQCWSISVSKIRRYGTWSPL